MASSVVDSADPRFKTAFPRLTDHQIEALERFGHRVKIKSGQNVWKAGDVAICMFVVMRGQMEVVDGRTGRYVANHAKGEFSGDIDVLSGRPALVSGIAQADMEVLEVPGDCVSSIVGELPEIGDVILRAFL